jgi:protein TonB
MTSRVRAALHAALQARFVYPRRARLRGWEGTVRIAVRVDAAGQILQLRVVESSHHAVLDRAALACLDRIRQVPGMVAWLDGHARDIVVPIEYRLTDG